MAGATEVTIEMGTKKVFASAVGWPGWCRSGKTEQLALESLSAYAVRYHDAARAAGVAFPSTAGGSFAVVEWLDGDGGTDFGVPGQVAAVDREPLSAAQAERLAKLVRGAWAVLDAVAATAPETLRKGPRGGGRDRDKIIDHVVESEASYGRMIDLKLKVPAPGDQAAIEANRDALAAAIAAGRRPPENPRRWPPRYAARRIAWHALDHAWEMEDRSV